MPGFFLVVFLHSRYLYFHIFARKSCVLLAYLCKAISMISFLPGATRSLCRALTSLRAAARAIRCRRAHMPRRCQRRHVLIPSVAKCISPIVSPTIIWFLFSLTRRLIVWGRSLQNNHYLTQGLLYRWTEHSILSMTTHWGRKTMPNNVTQTHSIFVKL